MMTNEYLEGFDSHAYGRIFPVGYGWVGDDVTPGDSCNAMKSLEIFS